MKKLTWDYFVDKFFWAMLLGITSYGLTEIRSVTESINSLNDKMSAVIAKMGDQSKSMDSLEQRVVFLERHSMRIKNASISK